MATYDLEEQEQIAEIKAWWKQYGARLVNTATVVVLIVLAWQGWNWYQRSQAAQASAIYGALQKAVEDGDTQQIKAASGELLEKFNGTPYAVLGALTSAKAMIEAGDAPTAKAQLLWAAEHAKDELRDLARLRAAAVLLDDKAYEQALAQLEGARGAAFDIRFQDMRGDILAAQGKKPEAVSAYQTALTRLDELEKSGKSGGAGLEWQGESNAVLRELIGQKVDALGGGQ
ncbi:MAG: tetratricopeptide repeat protein [Candidatus Accumulibacter sp.]|jgi:predicted negative regulator of RcsB-dependent stress response|nr:tetratricopeptide repeat protein [Accumulibacter sp.]